jgi:hydrogenase-4 component F
MLIAALLAIPILLSVFPLFIRQEKPLGVMHAAGYGVMLLFFALFARGFIVNSAEVNMWGWVHIDALSVFFILTALVVSFAASIYSIGYIHEEVREGKVTPVKARAYYYLFNFFCFAMVLAPMLDNLAFVWIAIEMTTLISAFLVGFHNIKESIEAAWKYIIICSVGITFALLGIIFFYYTSLEHSGIRSLNWTVMASEAHLFDPKIVKIALLFIFVGYGTKAGFAPMHNWLPDAHSQALSPISALLSGVLLKISLYAILRFVILANLSAGYEYSAKLFIIFGVCSVSIAACFMLVQKDLKRLFAYSSVENIGLISLGFGFGAYGGIFAGLLHIFNHALTKAYMFFCAGNAVRAYHSSNMNTMRGLLKAMPFTGAAMFLGVFALGGIPPFSIFISKLLILIAAFQGKRYVLALFMFIFMAIAFAGLLQHISKVVLGNKPKEMPRLSEPSSAKLALLILGIVMLGFGLSIPKSFFGLLLSCQKLILGS